MDPAIVSIGQLIPPPGSQTNDIPELLQPYTKDDLCQLLVEATMADPHFYQRLRHFLNHDKKWCKLFVHGLSYNTTNATLHEFYSQFGQLKEAVVLMDKKGQSKGYGFVTYVDRMGALNATKVDRHKIDNRMTHCCLAFYGNPRKIESSTNNGTPVGETQNATTENAPNHQQKSTPDTDIVPSPHSTASTKTSTSNANPIPRPTAQNNTDPSRQERRLFVHSLAWKTDDETLRNTFIQYGEIEEAIVIRDKKTHKSKGYGFVVFTTPESARKALASPEKTIDNRQTKCNLACERPAHLTPQHVHPPPVVQPTQVFPQYMPNRGPMGPPIQMNPMGNLDMRGQMPIFLANPVGPIPVGPGSATSGSLPMGSMTGGQMPMMFNSFPGSVSSGGQPFSPNGFIPRASSSVSSASGVPPNILMPYPQMPPFGVNPVTGLVAPEQQWNTMPKKKIVAVRNPRMQNVQRVDQPMMQQQFVPMGLAGGPMNPANTLRPKPSQPVVTEHELDELQSDRSSPRTQKSLTPEPMI